MSEAVARAKLAAATRAAAEVRDGMLLGLGSGSTSELAIDALGARIRDEGLWISGVPTSERTAARARAAGIPLLELTAAVTLDRTIDGADEVDPRGNMIKGGGGALLREKLVALASRERVIICDDRKRLPYLGAFPLPVVVVPFGWETTRRRIEAMGYRAILRRVAGEPLVTDDGLHLLDLACGRIDDPAALEAALNAVPGVVEVGLFVGITTRVLYGFPDGHVEEWVPPTV